MDNIKTSPQTSRAARIFKNILFIIGLGIILVMITSFGDNLPSLKAALSRSIYVIPLILLIWICIYLLNTWAWQVIIKGSGPCNVRFSRLFKWTLSGFALNSLTPIDWLGGEPYKVVELSPHIGSQRATSSVILFTMTHIYGHFWFWLTGIVVFLILAMFEAVPLTGQMLGVLLLAMVLCLGAIYLFLRGYRKGFILKIVHLLNRVWLIGRWSRRMEERHQDTLTKVDTQIRQLHEQSRRAFYGSFFLEYGAHVLQSFEVFTLLVMLGLPTHGGIDGYLLLWLHSFLILSFTSLFADLLGFVPMQMGTREGGYVLGALQMGFEASQGVFVSLICRARELLWDVVGLILIKIK